MDKTLITGKKLKSSKNSKTSVAIIFTAVARGWVMVYDDFNPPNIALEKIFSIYMCHEWVYVFLIALYVRFFSEI